MLVAILCLAKIQIDCLARRVLAGFENPTVSGAIQSEGRCRTGCRWAMEPRICNKRRCHEAVVILCTPIFSPSSIPTITMPKICVVHEQLHPKPGCCTLASLFTARHLPLHSRLVRSFALYIGCNCCQVVYVTAECCRGYRILR